MARHRRRTNPWASQAAQEALVRYGPEWSGLNEIQRQAVSDYQTSVRQARGTAQGVVAEANAARPGVRQIYRHAGLAQARTAHTLEGDTAALGPVANSIKAGAALEQTVGLRHLQEAKAAALTDLSSRAVAAKEGRVWATQKARDDFAKTISSVLARKADLGREEGAFTASTMGTLMQAALDRRQQLAIERARLNQQDRNSLRSAGIDPNTGRAIRGGPLDPHSPLNRQRLASARHQARSGRGGSGSSGRHLTPNELGTVQDATATALDWAGRLRQGGLGIQDAVTALVGGRKATTVPLHDQNGKPMYNKDGTPKVKQRGGIPAIGHQVIVQAAVEQAYNGFVTPRTARELRRRGISLRALGLTPPESFRRRTNRHTRRTYPGGSSTGGRPDTAGNPSTGR